MNSDAQDVSVSEQDALLSFMSTLASDLGHLQALLLNDKEREPLEQREGMHLSGTVVLLRSSDCFIAEPPNTIQLSNVLLISSSCLSQKRK
jgi:hypothetical protein